jgi:hypothetical protein
VSHVLRLVLVLVSKFPRGKGNGTQLGAVVPRRTSGDGSLSGTQSTRSGPHRWLARWGVVALVLIVMTAVLSLRGAPAQRLGGDQVAPGTGASTSTVTAVDPASASAASRPAPSVAPKRTASTAQAPRARSAPRPAVTIPAQGPKQFGRAALNVKPSSKRGELIRFDVQVEKNLPYDSQQTARLIATVLNDTRSWTGSGDYRFELVSAPAQADLHAYLATPGTTDALCAPLRTLGEVSCQNGRSVVLNAKRWAYGAKAYGTDVASYRQYLINHEFGHALGRGHVGCPVRGRPASVMLQQTKGLRGCRANAWPAPHRR